MKRTLLYAIAGGLVAIVPVVSHVHAQTSEDTRIQLFQGVARPAPGTQPIGPVVRPFGYREDSTGARGGAQPATEPDRPPMGFGPAGSGSAPNIGETTIPSTGMGRYGAGASSAER
jgi:hypothetical protein